MRTRPSAGTPRIDRSCSCSPYDGSGTTAPWAPAPGTLNRKSSPRSGRPRRRAARAAPVTEVTRGARLRVEHRPEAVAPDGRRRRGDPVVVEEAVADGEGPPFLGRQRRDGGRERVRGRRRRRWPCHPSGRRRSTDRDRSSRPSMPSPARAGWRGRVPTTLPVLAGDRSSYLERDLRPERVRDLGDLPALLLERLDRSEQRDPARLVVIADDELLERRRERLDGRDRGVELRGERARRAWGRPWRRAC